MSKHNNQQSIEYPASHPVVDELQRRIAGESPQHRLALSIEGGGMRSVVSAGMISALEANGIGPEYFDAVIGSSGGAFNAAYFVAGQAQYGTPSYYENTGNNLISMRRALARKGPYINMDHMLGPVANEDKPLKFEEVVAARKLRVMATRLDNMTPHLFDHPNSKEEILAQLKASSAVPILGGPAVEIEGVKYVDAGITEKQPLDTPIAHGYDAVLVLSTHALRTTFRSNSKLRLGAVVGTGLGRVSPLLSCLMLQNDRKLIAMTESPALQPPYAFAVCPPVNSASVNWLELATEPVAAGAQLGYTALASALDL